MNANIEQPALFKITQAQKERMEKSKMKAKALKHARLTSHYHPYKNDQEHKAGTGKVASRDVTSATSRGGYMIDGNDKEAPVPEYKLVEEEGTECVDRDVSIHCMVMGEESDKSQHWGNSNIDGVT